MGSVTLARAISRIQWWLPLLAAAALACPRGADAQGFSPDYGLSPGRTSAVSLGPVRLDPVFHGDARSSSVGLSIAAGKNWFAQAGVGHSLDSNPALPGSTASTPVVNIAGGYRWSDGQSLSLQVSRGREAERLGLSVSYDWPRYFVRLSYDSKLSPLPQDSLRFSAGVRF